MKYLRILWLIIPVFLIIVGELLKDGLKNFIHNLTYNPAFDGILFLSFFIFIAFLKWKVYSEDREDCEKLKQIFITENNINIIQGWFLEKLIDNFIEKNKDFFEGNKNKPIENLEPNKDIQEQMKKAKLNTYNNSYLTFCLLIDRCKTINFKENNDYQENEKPYCFKEIAEAFDLKWEGRRYYHYIANVLDQIFKFTEQQNNPNDTIPTINASTVTKFERDNFNKWFCNGHIRGSGRHCYPKYTLIEGKEDREYILELCKIVKEAKEDKIAKWKKDFYGYLTNNKGTFDILDKEKLNEIYKEYNNKTITKMSYQKLEEKAKEDNSNKDNKNNDKKNGGKNK